ncbi:MAG: hypothetical protein QXO55_04760 [Candidatus Korarchaeum sp.]
MKPLMVLAIGTPFLLLVLTTHAQAYPLAVALIWLALWGSNR